MDSDVLLSGVPVSDFKVSQAWYERFFGRVADVVAHEAEVMWRVSAGGWLYILRDAGRAGNGIVTIGVSDIEAATSALEEQGIAIGPITPEGDSGRKAVAVDPDGNSVAIIQVIARA
jgi:predicted enzyme related to lactoylglutathione lyase